MDYPFSRACPSCGLASARSYARGGYCCGHCGQVTALGRPDLVIGELERWELRPARHAAANGCWKSRNAGRDTHTDRRGDGKEDHQAA